MNKQRGFISLIVILIVVTISIWYIANILDSQYQSSQKSPEELKQESVNRDNVLEKTKNLKFDIESNSNIDLNSL